MRISHSQLAECQSNPRQWLARSTAGFARFGFNRALKYAIYAYHKSDGRDVPAYLRHLLRNFSNEQRKAETESLLLRYIEWAERSSIIVGGAACTSTSILATASL